MDPTYLHMILMQLEAVFPEHTVTLVLRCPEDASRNHVVTTDHDPVAPSVMLGRWVLDNFKPEVRH